MSKKAINCEIQEDIPGPRTYVIKIQYNNGVQLVRTFFKVGLVHPTKFLPKYVNG